MQSIALVKVSILGNIALWIKERNLDMVEYMITTDVDVLGSQRELIEPSK